MDLHLPEKLNSEKIAGYLPHKPHKVTRAIGGKNVGTAERVLSGALGFMMLGMAMKRGKLGKALMIPLGLAALKRAATGKCEIYQAAGLSSAEEKNAASENSVDDLKKNFGEKSIDHSTGQQYYV
jgi:hypothetical protein